MRGGVTTSFTLLFAVLPPPPRDTEMTLPSDNFHDAHDGSYIRQSIAGGPGYLRAPIAVIMGVGVVKYGQPIPLISRSYHQDPEVDPGSLVYLWEFVEGTGTITDPTQAVTTATVPVEGKYTIRLTVSDGVNSSSALLKVTVVLPILASSEGVITASSPQASATREVSGASDPLVSLSAVGDASRKVGVRADPDINLGHHAGLGMVMSTGADKAIKAQVGKAKTTAVLVANSLGNEVTASQGALRDSFNLFISSRGPFVSLYRINSDGVSLRTETVLLRPGGGLGSPEVMGFDVSGTGETFWSTVSQGGSKLYKRYEDGTLAWELDGVVGGVLLKAGPNGSCYHASTVGTVIKRDASGDVIWEAVVDYDYGHGYVGHQEFWPQADGTIRTYYSANGKVKTYSDINGSLIRETPFNPARGQAPGYRRFRTGTYRAVKEFSYSPFKVVSGSIEYLGTSTWAKGWTVDPTGKVYILSGSTLRIYEPSGLVYQDIQLTEYPGVTSDVSALFLDVGDYETFPEIWDPYGHV